MALDYRQVSDLYKTLKDSGATTLELPEWSQQMNQLSGTDAYAAGLNDNWIKRASVGVDRALESTGIPQASEGFGRRVGELIGAGDTGAAIGKATPRGLVDFASLFVPGAEELGLGNIALRYAPAAVSSFANTYTATDSIGAGVLGAATNLVMPGVAHTAEQQALKLIGADLIKGPLAKVAADEILTKGATSDTIRQLNEYASRGTLDSLVATAAGQGAVGATMTVGGLGQQALAGEDLSLDPKELALNMTLGALPFAIPHLAVKGVHALTGKTTTGRAEELQGAVAQTQKLIDAHELIRQQGEKSNYDQIDPLPKDVADPATSAEFSARVAGIQEAKAKSRSGEVPLTEDEWNTLSQEENSLIATMHEQTGGVGTIGGKLISETPRVDVSGTQHYTNADQSFRIIKVQEGDPLIGQPDSKGRIVQAGDGIGFPTNREPATNAKVKGEVGTFSVPSGGKNHFTVFDDKDIVAGEPTQGLQPELPTQATPTDLQVEFERQKQAAASRELAKVKVAEAEKQITAATTPDELDAAVQKVNEVRDLHDMLPVDDRMINAQLYEMQRYNESGAPEPTRREAVQKVLNDTNNRITLQTEREKRIDQRKEGDQFRAKQEVAAQNELEAGEVREGGDSNLVAEINDLHGLEKAITKKGAQGALMVSSGELNRLYQQWVDGGRKGEFDALRQRVLLHVESREGLPGREKVSVPKAKDEVTRSRDDAILVQGLKVLETIEDETDRGLMLDAIEARDVDMVAGIVKDYTGGSLAPEKNRVPAGNGWIWGMESYDPTTNKLGKHTLPKSGVVPISQLKTIAGKGKPLPDGELTLARELVPEAFEGDMVNVRELYRLLPERAPVLEEKKLSNEEGKGDFGVQQAIHELETDGFNVFEDDGWKLMDENDEDVDPSSLTPRQQELLTTLQNSGRSGHEGQTKNAMYSFLGPKSEQEMPGYVEGLVRLTKPNSLTYEQWLGEGEDTLANRELYKESTESFNRVTNTKFRGPHFGSEDTNVVAFYRGYEEVVNGEKVFHVIEVQSDWAQRRRELEQDLKKSQIDEGDYQAHTAGRDSSLYTPSSPLLRVYETLALKSAIKHAQEIGATKIVLSDAETAMMTEGHDRVGIETGLPIQIVVDRINQNNLGEATIRKNSAGQTVVRIKGPNMTTEQLVTADGYSLDALENYLGKDKLLEYFPESKLQEPSQSAGMRLHYDQTLPSALKKLTGDNGERVELGTHKTTKVDPNQESYDPVEVQDQLDSGEITQEDANAYLEAYRNVKPIGSPVFRNPDGTPKSSITGRSYDLKNAFDTLNEQGGHTLFDPSRAPFKPFVPQTSADEDFVASLGTTGNSVIDYLQNSPSPLIQKFRSIFPQWRDTASRVKVFLHDDYDGAAVARGLSGLRSEIHLDAGLRFSFSKTDLDEIVAHELIHTLTNHAIADPKNADIVKELNVLRMRTIENLTIGHQERINRALESGWIDKFYKAEGAERKELWKELGRTDGERDISYALLNNDEFLAQAFTDSSVHNLLRSQKSQRKLPLLKQLASWVRRLLGAPEESQTAFDELLYHTDNLAKRQNTLATFQNFGEKYLMNKGLSEGRARIQTSRALGLIRAKPEQLTRSNLIDSLYEHKTGSPEVVRAQQKLAGFFNSDRTQELAETGQVLQETGHAPSEEGAKDFVSTLLAEPSTVSQQALDLLPKEIRDLVFAHAQDMSQVLDVLHAGTSNGVADFLNVADPEKVGLVATQAKAQIRRILKAQKSIEERENEFNALQGLAPDVALDNAINRAPEKGKKDEEVGAISRFLAPMWQIARREPLARPIIGAGFQLEADGRTGASKALHVLGMRLTDGEVTPKAIELFYKALQRSGLGRAVGDWIFADQKAGKDSVSVLDPQHPEVQKALAKLTPSQRTEAIEIRHRLQMMNKLSNEESLKNLQQIASWRAAEVIAKWTGAKSNVNFEFANEMFEALKLSATNPQEGQARITALQQKMGGDGQAALNLLKFQQASLAEYQLYKQKYDANPGWATNKRYGKYEFSYKKSNGDVVYDRAGSEREAKKLAEGKALLSFKLSGDRDKADLFGANTEEVVTKLRQLDAVREDIMRRAGRSEEDIALDQKYSVSGQYATEAANVGGVSSVIPNNRRLTKMPDNFNWVANQMTYVTNRSFYEARQLFRARTAAMLKEPELQPRQDIINLLKTHAENLLEADPEFATTARRFMTHWLLSGSVASAMGNGTQIAVRGMAELTSHTGKPIDSMNRILSAAHQVLSHKLKGIPYADTRITRMLKQAANDGQLGGSVFDANDLSDLLTPLKAKQAMEQVSEKTGAQNLASKVGSVFSAGMFLFRNVEKFNLEASLVARFKLALDEGKTESEAYNAAKLFNGVVNDVGGKANRPTGLYSGRDQFSRSAALLSSSMQGYFLGSTAQLITYLKQGGFRPRGLTPNEVWNARKAATQMLAVQFAMAGTLGMPFAAGGLALLNTAFPQLEINKNLREWIADLFGDDEGNGNILSDIAMSGIPSTFGWDWQSRLNAGQLPGVSELNGFQPGALAGPLVSILGNFAKGSAKLASGDVSGVQNLLPPSIKKLADLVSNEGTVKDYRDRPLFEPTGGEKLGMALGFNPTRLSNFNAASRIATQSEKVATQRESQFHEGLANEILRGNFGTVRSKLLQRANEDPSFDPVSSVRSIARAAEELTFPRDLRREGTQSGSTARSRLLSSFNLSPTLPTESARLQFRQSVEQRLGVAPVRSGAFREAELMDQLRAIHPEATRLELRQLAAGQLRPSRQTPTLLPASL